MGRNNISQEIRQRVGILEVLGRYGLHPDRAGFLNCPFHPGDRSASLKVYTGDNTWHCFGCHRYGSVIDFVMEMEHVSFMEAVKIMDKDFALGLLDQQPQLRRKRAWEDEKKQSERLAIYRKQALLWLLQRCRELWWEYKMLDAADDNSAQNKALLMAEIEHYDYLIEGRR